MLGRERKSLAHAHIAKLISPPPDLQVARVVSAFDNAVEEV
jgi:hypothetical protein